MGMSWRSGQKTDLLVKSAFSPLFTGASSYIFNSDWRHPGHQPRGNNLRQQAARTQLGRQRQKTTAPADHPGGAGLARRRGDHPAERWPPYDGRRHTGSGQDGRRPGRAHLPRRPGKRGRPRSNARRHAHLPAAGRAHLARGSTHDRRRDHHAGTAEALRSVYENLGSQVQVQTRETEVTALIALLSAVFALGAGVLSLLWFRRLAITQAFFNITH